jgi:hypothetical protein
MVYREIQINLSTFFNKDNYYGKIIKKNSIFPMGSHEPFDVCR